MVVLQKIIMGNNMHCNARGGRTVYLSLSIANRHSLIIGATTGTGGKERATFCRVDCRTAFEDRISVFASDVKGDFYQASIKPVPSQGCAVIFWNLYGRRSMDILLWAIISEAGPLLFSRFLNSNDVQ